MDDRIIQPSPRPVYFNQLLTDQEVDEAYHGSKISLPPSGEIGDVLALKTVNPDSYEWIKPIGEQGPQGEQGVQGIQGVQGPIGPSGKSAYQVALENGFEGTEEEWLKSLIGPEGPQGKQGEQGIQGEPGPQGEPGNAAEKGDPGDPGLSAYQLAQENGYSGTLEEWLESLRGPQGIQGETGPKGENGDSAYQVAIQNGYEGSESDWLLSLKGPQGEPGLSAYQVAEENGFEGTQDDWLKSLQGEPGADANPNIYTSTPKIIGIWDDMALERITLSLIQPNITGDTLIAENIISDYVLNYQVFIYSISEEYTYKQDMTYASSVYSINNNLYIHYPTDTYRGAISKVTITIQYKNPNKNVPSFKTPDYSYNLNSAEKLVGAYFDENLYETSFQFNIPSTITNFVTIAQIPNLKEIISLYGSILIGTTQYPFPYPDPAVFATWARENNNINLYTKNNIFYGKKLNFTILYTKEV